MEKLLITGATGFLGEYLVRRLVGEYEVHALGRNEGRGAALEALGAVFRPGDFTDREGCSPYFAGMDYVIHAGALSTVWGAWEDFRRVNVEGTRNVAELCLQHGVRRMVFLSSPSIYTEKRDRFDIREDAVNPANRLNDYIRSKIQAEAVVADAARSGLDTVVLRPRGLIGVGDTSLIPRALRANQKIGVPLLRGGRNIVDITCVENVAEACALCLTAEDAAGEAFNITNDEPMAFREILEEFLAVIGETPRYLRLPFPLLYGAACLLEAVYRRLQLSGEPMLTRYTVCTLGFSQSLDIAKAREKLGYAPIITLSEGIRNYGEWWKTNTPH